MTDAEKTMKKYVNAVERRLNLPREVKARVISDFTSSIAARREAGQTDEQILAELGDPKKAAAELNEQMKEFAYRKSPWRFFFLAIAIASGGWLLMYSALNQVFRNLLNLQPGEAESVGIIGGADGPTAIIVATTTGPDWDLILITGLLLLGLYGFFRLRKYKSKKK